MIRESSRWAAIGWGSPSIRHIIWRERATETAEVLSAISRAISYAADSSSSGGCTERTSPADRASSGPKTRPVATHSMARCIPTARGRNQLAADSGTMPRRAKTKPNFAEVEASRMSMGRVMLAPTPAAGPLTAAMTGLVLEKMRSSATRPRCPGAGRPHCGGRRTTRRS